MSPLALIVLGRLSGAKGPGLFLVPPFISRMVKVDLRIVTLTVPPQEVITRDNVTIRVTAVEIKDVELPATMQRARAKQAEAEREKRAKVIPAEGELLASTQLAQAAAVIGSQRCDCATCKH
jgi:regulator of protease activity HflC (stomatin/prohibitin superfamily)